MPFDTTFFAADRASAIADLPATLFYDDQLGPEQTVSCSMGDLKSELDIRDINVMKKQTVQCVTNRKSWARPPKDETRIALMLPGSTTRLSMTIDGILYTADGTGITLNLRANTDKFEEN